MQYVVPITQPNWLDSRADLPMDQVICALDEARADSCLFVSPGGYSLLPPSFLSPPPPLPHLPNCQLLLFNCQFLVNSSTFACFYPPPPCATLTPILTSSEVSYLKKDKQDG